MSAAERIPKNPVISCQSFVHDREGFPSVLDAGEARYLNRGSLAIAYALKRIGISRGDEVLMPAYHCLAMVEPVIWAGAKPVFFRISESTGLDLEDVERRLTRASRVLIAPHYFGFHQDMPKIRAFCDRHHLVLIEDCAHAFLGETAGHPLGYYGDYAIGSAWKFFPVDEGACVVSSLGGLFGAATEPRGFFSEIKSLMNTLEYAVEYRRLGWLNPVFRLMFRLKDGLWSMLKKKPSVEPVVHEENPGGSTGFDGSRVGQDISRSSRLIISASSKSRMARKRRENYLKLLSRFGDLPGCRPLFGVLPDGVVPHVFPLVMENPEKIFHKLKDEGVPVIRFGEYLSEDMEKGLCKVSEDYSRRVFQFPCHQDLKSEELDWMVDRIADILLHHAQE